MINKPDWDKTQQKFLEYWSRENHDRPLINIQAPISIKQQEINRGLQAERERKLYKNHEEKWLDMDGLILEGRERLHNTFFGLESFPMLWPNLGPDIFGATFGADIVFEETTSYSVPFIHNAEQFGKLAFDPKNTWWQKMLQMTDALIDDAKGDYLVGITDLHPGADGLVSLRGPEGLCMDLFDSPEKVKEGIDRLYAPFIEQLDTLYKKTSQCQRGTSNWMSIWHPEKWYVTSSDFIGMISEAMFEEFIAPELEMEINSLPQKSIFHLDGPGALKHLDRILEIPNLAGVQWVYGAGQPTAKHWIPTLKKIQAAGKNILVNAYAEDLDVLLREIKPEGVMYYVEGESSATLEDAHALIKLVESSYKKKVY